MPAKKQVPIPSLPSNSITSTGSTRIFESPIDFPPTIYDTLVLAVGSLLFTEIVCNESPAQHRMAVKLRRCLNQVAFQSKLAHKAQRLMNVNAGAMLLLQQQTSQGSDSWILRSVNIDVEMTKYFIRCAILLFDFGTLPPTYGTTSTLCTQISTALFLSSSHSPRAPAHSLEASQTALSNPQALPLACSCCNPRGRLVTWMR